MSQDIKCPQCNCEYPYEDRGMYVCPQCGHEWNPSQVSEINDEAVKDAYGTKIRAGDSVTVIKDLKIKGSSSVVKIGTKVKIIRLLDGDHNIDCNIDGIGAMKLKSEFVKKV